MDQDPKVGTMQAHVGTFVEEAIQINFFLCIILHVEWQQMHK